MQEQAGTRFSDDYPDVIRIKAEMGGLEGQLTKAKADGSLETEPAAGEKPCASW